MRDQAMWMIELAWLVPVLPLVSAALIAVVGKRLPRGGAEIGILAMLASLVLSVSIAINTFVDHGQAPYEAAFAWSPLGGGFVL